MIAQDPARLTVDELVQRIVADPEDSREVRTATRAIRELRESGLIRCGDDERVEPTKAALHANSLFGT